MRTADRYFALLGLGWALLACNQASQDASNTAAATEIEALPPDESVEAPANEPSNADAAEY